MKKIAFVCLALLATFSAVAQRKSLNYYLPETVTYDAKIPTPEQFFGFQVGEQHASHDQIVAYMTELDRLSDRISLQIIGRTYEFRPLMILTITSPDNQARIEQIRTEHLKLTDPSVSGGVDVSKLPIVVYQGHSIHGNEPSGAEFKKSLADSIAQATAAQPPEISSTQTAAKVSQALGQIGGADSVLGSLKFSAHAVDRMKSRGISFAPEVMKGIESAVSRAAAKGSKDTLVLAGDNALIVSVKNNTVVTVMDKNAMRDNVFTNIDSTVVV